MARTITKSGSKVIVTCPVCGRSMTKAGLIGHMRFKHGRDHKLPMIPIDRLEPGTATHANVQEQIACPGCRETIIAALHDTGYTITPPKPKITSFRVVDHKVDIDHLKIMVRKS